MMTATETGTAERVALVRQRIAAAESAAGRAPGSVRLLAVTKTHPPQACREAVEAGVVDLAENRVQELVAKAKALASSDVAAQWHLVGPLQSNKLGRVVDRGWWLHSVDRPTIVESLARRCARPARQPILIQVNIGADPAKSGCTPQQAPALVALACSLGLDVRGLMTVPPQTADPGRQFAALRELCERLRRDHHGLVELSMGMSDDFETAIAEGATLIRIGSAIFGQRHDTAWRPS